LNKPERERGPGWTATQLKPFVVRHDGKEFRCWVDGGPVSMSGPAIIKPLRWTVVAPDGVQREGWLADPPGDESAKDVEQEVKRWWDLQKQQG
jgi:hypothetical protein